MDGLSMLELLLKELSEAMEKHNKWLHAHEQILRGHSEAIDVNWKLIMKLREDLTALEARVAALDQKGGES